MAPSRVNLMEIEVGRMGSKILKVSLRKGQTAGDALEAAGLSAKNSEEVYVNGEEESSEYVLEDGDRVLLVKNVEGAR